MLRKLGYLNHLPVNALDFNPGEAVTAPAPLVFRRRHLAEVRSPYDLCVHVTLTQIHSLSKARNSE